jgi:23S rRNA pseudouridine1911/1915/1917 synthase
MHAPIKLSSPETHEFWEIAALFEDEHLLAIDKPRGLLISPNIAAPERPSLRELMHRAIRDGKPWAKERGLEYLANAQRLDPDIGGVLLLAKSKTILIKLANLLGAEKPYRHYLVLAQGEPSSDRLEMGASIGPFPGREGMMRVDPKHGKRARTVFEVKERFDGFTLIRCDAWTERRHQVRVHLQNLGIPVVGDRPYGGRPLLLSQLKSDYRLKRDKEERPLLDSPAVHMEEITIEHPVTGVPLSIRAEWPKEFTVAIKYLRRYAAVP